MQRATIFTLSLLLLLTLAVTMVFAAPASISHSPAYWWWGDGAGTSTLVRSKSGISGTYRVSLANDAGSYKGHAVTLWIIVFNNPDACVDDCNDADAGNPDVMFDALYGGGHVIGKSQSANFAFHIKEGDTSGSIVHLFGLPSHGLKDASKAEIHYVLRTHGPKDAAEMPSPIHSYPGGCDSESDFPGSAADLVFGEGMCQDFQFAVHLAP